MDENRNDQRNLLNSILMNYHMLEMEENYENINEFSTIQEINVDNKLSSSFCDREVARNIKCLDIRSMQMVLIKIYSPCSDNQKIKNTSIFTEIIKIIDHKSLPVILREEIVDGYKIVIQEIAEGNDLDEICSFTNLEAISICSNLLCLLHYLHIIKAVIPEIDSKDFIITSENTIKINNLKFVYFSNKNDEMFKICNFLKIFNLIKSKIKEPLDCKITNLVEYFRKRENQVGLNSYTFSEICDIFNVQIQVNSYNTTFIDCVVVNEITKYGFTDFLCQNINNKNTKDYFIYRLTERYLMSFKKYSKDSKFESNCFNSNYTFRNANVLNCVILLESFVLDSNTNTHTTNVDLPNIFKVSLKNFKAYFQLNENKKTFLTQVPVNHQHKFINFIFPSFLGNNYIPMIIERALILHGQIQFKENYCNFFRCRFSYDQAPFLAFKCYEIKKLKMLFETLSKINTEFFIREGMYNFESKRMNLVIETEIKSNNEIVFTKLKGRNYDFIRVISEIIQLSKINFTD